MTADVRRGWIVHALPRLIAILCATFAISACSSARPRIVPPPSSSARAAELKETIERILDDPALGRGTWGILVKSLTRNNVLYALNEGKLLVPASSMKVVTLAVAADRL